MKEVVHNLIPHKGVVRKSNVEGSELMDGEGDEISVEEQQQEYEQVPDKEESNVIEPVEETSPSNNSSSVPKRHASLLKSTNDPDIKKDPEFLEKFKKIMTDASTSKLCSS